ncbi:hypothetical protein BJV74DRAFT_990464 [Russula compacta]|nr:hypothetical protein BJV74DRAFT_990464 [Russula compacta]
MRASFVVSIFYLAARIAPSFAAPALLASDLAKLKETASYALQHSGSTSSDSGSTLSDFGSTASDFGSTSSDFGSTSSHSGSSGSESTVETTTNAGSGGTSKPETTTPTTEDPAAEKWYKNLELTEQTAQTLGSGLTVSAMLAGLSADNSSLARREVLERFEARIDHELVARARPYRREALTMLLGDLD